MRKDRLGRGRYIDRYKFSILREEFLLFPIF